jgi:hypothetical protein
LLRLVAHPLDRLHDELASLGLLRGPRRNLGGPLGDLVRRSGDLPAVLWTAVTPRSTLPSPLCTWVLTFSASPRIVVTTLEISLLEEAVLSASSRISEATTLKPRPCSPA